MLNKSQRLVLVYLFPALLGISVSISAFISYKMNEKDAEIRDLKNELELVNNFYTESILISQGSLYGRSKEKDGYRGK